MTHANRALWGACLAAMLWMVSGASVLAADTSGPASPYRLGPEDVLDISVWKEQDLQKQVVVLPDGSISFPLVGSLQAAGHTPEEVQAQIAKRLQKFIPDPVVTVAVAHLNAYQIYVIGKVGRPGVYPVGRRLDVVQALALAGGLNPFAAANDIKILRREGGKQTTLNFRYADIEAGKRLDQNILLQPGDVIVVP